MKIRSFLAFDIPTDVQQKLGRLIADFATKEQEVRWLKPSDLHVTMKFFGDVEEDLLLGGISEAIAGVTEAAVPASIDCQGVGVFPNWKYPRIIWAGFIGDTEPVLSLKEKLDSALSGFPLKPDQRQFRLHLTVGRAKEIKGTSRLVQLINGLGPVEFGKVRIDHLTIYKSVLTREGSIYTALKRFELKAKQTS